MSVLLFWPAESGGNVTLTPAAATLVLTGVAPRLDLSVPASAAALTLTGATAVIGTGIAPAVGTLVLTGATPGIVLGTVVQPAIGTLNLTGVVPTVMVSNHITLTPGVASIALAGQVSRLDLLLAPSVAGLTLAGIAPTVTVGGSVDVSPGLAALTITGLAPTVTVDGPVTISPDLAVLTLTGIAPVVIAGGDLPPAPIGGGVTFRRRKVIRVSPRRAALTLRGRTSNVVVTRSIALVPVVFAMAMTGYKPTLTIDSRMREAEREREDEALLLGIDDLIPA